jgi:hypothetical protein
MTSLFWAVFFVVTFHAGAVLGGPFDPLITFEEPIPAPGAVTTQYCNGSVANRGVQFLSADPFGGSRVFEPPVATSSPTHALTTEKPGNEFDQMDHIGIRFTAPQSEVNVKVGLDRSYEVPFQGTPVVAVMSAYSGETPGDGFLTHSTLNLGSGPTPIDQPLSVSSPDENIRSVTIEFIGEGLGLYAYEVIDDLSFSQVGGLCLVDTTDPSIWINKPDYAQEFFNPRIEIDFVATDWESGVARIEVQFLYAGVAQKSFEVCGGEEAPACLYTDQAPFESSYGFFTYLPDQADSLQIRVWDFSGRDTILRSSIKYGTPGPSTNLWAMGLEITQATQLWVPENTDRRLSGEDDPPTYYYNSPAHYVPLAANRTTVVRVYGGVENTVNDVPLLAEAWLRCYTNSAYVYLCPGPALIPATPGTILVSPGDTLEAKRQDASLSWNFVLPDEWIGAGSIHLEAEITADHLTPECAGCEDSANRIRVANIRFWEVEPFGDVVHVLRNGRRTKCGGGHHFPTTIQLINVLEYFEKIYPIDESTVPALYHGPAGFVDNNPCDGEGMQCSEILDYLEDSTVSDVDKKVILLITDSEEPKLCRGLGRFNGYAVARADATTAAAHEVGHGFKLRHAGPLSNPHGDECKRGEDGCETEWPWPHGTLGGYGFDVFDTTGDPVVIPGTTESDPHDIMSYGGPDSKRWISPRTWIRLFNFFADESFSYPTASSQTTSTRAPESTVAATAQYLLVGGRWDEGVGWILSPAYEVERPVGSDDEPGEGDYRIELLDSSGEVLSVRWFSLRSDHVDTDDPNVVLIPPPSFTELLPLPADVVTIALRRDTETLAERTRSANTPTVEILSPTAAGFDGQPLDPRILWSGEDADGGALSYMVQYNPGSGPHGERGWQNLGSDLTDPEFLVSLDDLAGGTEARVRVLATDGFNTGVAVSPSFVVPGKPPHVRILSPSHTTVYQEGDRIVLRGTASDREDGILSPEDLSWHSHLDGLLGTGRRLEVSTLSPGVHGIVLEAEDSDGQTGGDLIAIEVEERPNSQPIADAGPDRAGARGISVALDGSGSSDADDDPLAFHWTVVSQPAGSNAALSNPEVAEPSFVGDADGAYEIELVVDDDQVGSVPDRVIVQLSLDETPPTTSISLDPAAPDGENGWYVSPVTVSLNAADNPGGAGLASTEYRLDGGAWQPYEGPFTVSEDSILTVEARSSDRAGNTEDPPVSATIQLDQATPIAAIETPAEGAPVHGTITLAASVSDATSGVESVLLYVRADTGGAGTPIGLEELAPTYNAASGHWEYGFDSTPLLDGAYLVLAKAMDNAGNESWSDARPFSIRNWVVIDLLPRSKRNKAERTIPIKFTLRVVAAVDPTQPFVRREDLTVKIYETAHPDDVLQLSTYGDGAKDYRIDDGDEHYITNFKTLTQPKAYTVEVLRGDFVLGSFGFATVK